MGKYYYTHKDRTFGPVSASKLRELAAAGQIDPKDVVFKVGGARPMVAGGIEGLFPQQTADHRPSSASRFDDTYFYCTRGDQQFGPFRANELKEVALNGRLKQTDVVWTTKALDWIEVGEVLRALCNPGELARAPEWVRSLCNALAAESEAPLPAWIDDARALENIELRLPKQKLSSVPAMQPEEPAVADVPPPPDKVEVRQWYYFKDGKQFGPVPHDHLKQLIRQRLLSETDKIWCQGMLEWKAVADCADEWQ
ncbi:MAG: hypothetical protein KatS3mg105_4696 [Gemmatales bacterium]|nr:MAG: hypothetical protein KatS3mg105_4696 [Gemmatales bacterium]